MARRIEGIPLPQWFGLDPGEFVNLVNHWIERGSDQVFQEGIYRTSAGRLVALDWKQPAQECLDIQERRGIICFCGCYMAFGTSGALSMVTVTVQHL